MAFTQKLDSMLDRNTASELCPVLASDEEKKYFFCDDNHFGACWISSPLTGVNSITQERMRGALGNDFPVGTVLQIGMLNTRDADVLIRIYASNRRGPKANGDLPPMLLAMHDQRVASMYQWINTAPIPSTRSKLNLPLVIVTIKIPQGKLSRDEAIDTICANAVKIEESFRGINMDLHRLDGDGYLTLLRGMIDPYQKYDDRRGYDDLSLISSQVFSPGDKVDFVQSGWSINDTMKIRVMSMHKRPKRTSSAVMGSLVGDPGGENNQFTCPFFLVTTIVIVDQTTTRAKLSRKASGINLQAFGPIMKYVPKLAHKKAGFDVMMHAIERGEPICQVMTTLLLFSNDQDEIDAMEAMATSSYAAYNYIIKPDKYIGAVQVMNNLPLFPSTETLKKTQRLNTMTINHAVQFVPLIADWQGTGLKGTSIFMTRRNIPMLVDFYDSAGSFNFAIFATSGSGKSYLAEQLVSDHLSMSSTSKVWLVDTGYSYKKLNRLYNGEYIEFSHNSPISLNPFTNIIDLKDEMDVLKNLLACMAAPNDGLNDYQMSELEAAIAAVWSAKGTEMNVTDVANYLIEQNEEEVHRIGKMLYPFTSTGQYGRWFDGPNNLNFNSRFVVLELEELKSRKHLSQVIMMLLISRLQYEMFLSGHSTRSMLLVDEGADILTQDSSNALGGFLDGAYRRIRKHGGCAGIITQRVADAAKTPAGQAILSNSPFKFILKQDAADLAEVERNQWLDLDPYGYSLLAGVHTVKNVYSEFMLISPMGYGIGRLVVDPFTAVVYSTDGDDRQLILQALRDGIDPYQACYNQLHKLPLDTAVEFPDGYTPYQMREFRKSEINLNLDAAFS